MKFRNTLTLTTQIASMVIWKQSTYRNHRARLHCSMWMGQHLSVTNLPFWTGGRSILVLSSTDQQISTPKLLPPATSWDKHRSRQTTQRGRSQEGNQATLYRKSPRCRCHPCRSIQAWWWHVATEIDRTFLLYVGWGSNTSAAQICVHHPPLQKGKSPALWKLQRNLSPCRSRKYTDTAYAQPPDSPLGIRPTSRESVRLPRWPRDRWYDLRCPPGVWRPLHNMHSLKAFDTVCRDGLWLIMEKFGCPRKCTALVRKWRTEGQSSWQQWYFGFISSHTRSETGLCSRPYSLQHGARCNASRCFTR